MTASEAARTRIRSRLFRGFACFPAGKNKVRLLSGACVLVSAISRSRRSSSFSAVISLKPCCTTHSQFSWAAAMREQAPMWPRLACGEALSSGLWQSLLLGLPRHPHHMCSLPAQSVSASLCACVPGLFSQFLDRPIGLGRVCKAVTALIPDSRGAPW